jgi:hypothetical protein
MAADIELGLRRTAVQEQYALDWAKSLDNLRSIYEAEEASCNAALVAEEDGLEKSVEQLRRALISDLPPELRQRSCDQMFEMVQRLAEIRSSANINKSQRWEAHRTKLLQHFAKYSELFPALSSAELARPLIQAKLARCVSLTCEQVLPSALSSETSHSRPYVTDAEQVHNVDGNVPQPEGLNGPAAPTLENVVQVRAEGIAATPATGATLNRFLVSIAVTYCFEAPVIVDMIY